MPQLRLAVFRLSTGWWLHPLELLVRGQGPCQGSRRGGVQGAEPLAHCFASTWSKFSFAGLLLVAPSMLLLVPVSEPCALFRLHFKQIQLRWLVVGRTIDAPPCPCQ